VFGPCTIHALVAASKGDPLRRVAAAAEPHAALISKAKPLLIASGKHRFAAAGTGSLRLRLTRAGSRRIRRALRRAKSVKLTIVTRFAPAAGVSVVAVKRVTVKSRPAKSARAFADRGDWAIADIRN
jgi:hypothetical protein